MYDKTVKQRHYAQPMCRSPSHSFSTLNNGRSRIELKGRLESVDSLGVAYMQQRVVSLQHEIDEVSGLYGRNRVAKDMQRSHISSRSRLAESQANRPSQLYRGLTNDVEVSYIKHSPVAVIISRPGLFF